MGQRFRARAIAVPCLLIALVAGLRAQDPPQPPAPAAPPASSTSTAPSPEPGIKTIFREFIHDEGQLWTAPFRGGSYSRYSIGGIVITGVLLGFDNEIANLAFISGSLNRSIGSKTPDAYFPSIVEQRGEAALAAQQKAARDARYAARSARRR